jgi:hypothetical protein
MARVRGWQPASTDLADARRPRAIDRPAMPVTQRQSGGAGEDGDAAAASLARRVITVTWQAAKSARRGFPVT